MSTSTELLVLAFAQESKADEVLKAMQQMIDAGKISVLNIAVLVKSKDGQTSIKDIQDVNLARGALFGAITGGLIGLVGGPVGLMLGAVAGATTGGVAAHTIDSGFPNDYLKELQHHLQPGSSALILLTWQEWSDRVMAALAPFDGRVIRHVMKEEVGAYLAAVGALDNDPTPPSELLAKLEAQIAAWQADIDRLTARIGTNGREIQTQLINLRTMQRLAQEKRYELLNAEAQSYTEKIENLQAKAKTAPEAVKAELLAELEATRAKRKVVREKLYAQAEIRIKGWQAEIDELKARLAGIKAATPERANARTAAMQQFINTFDEPVLPAEENEANARIADLYGRIEAAEAELQHEQELQIAVWQAAIRDMQVYLATPGVSDHAAVSQRIEEVQEQVKEAQARLKAQLEAQMSGWQAEIKDLQAQAVATEAPGQARIKEHIEALQAEIETLQAQADATPVADQARAKACIAALQAKIAQAQAKLQSLD
ncbi:MAG TPA: DUF1269 domain-containing protein [Anaerolineae bacterium]|nr:DUF1269 domain-containing protein [Anaerolineae bacterium]